MWTNGNAERTGKKNGCLKPGQSPANIIRGSKEHQMCSDAAQAERSGLSAVILSAQLRASSFNTNRRRTQYQYIWEATIVLFRTVMAKIYVTLWIQSLLNCHILKPAANGWLSSSFGPLLWPPHLGPGGTYMRQWPHGSGYYRCPPCCAASLGRSPGSPTHAPPRTGAPPTGLRLEYQTGTNSRLSHPHWCK